MKKVAVVLAIIAVIVIIIFAFQKCTLRTKTDPTTTDNSAQTDVDNTTTENTSTDLDERNAFIEANVDFSCQILKSTAILEDETQTKEILDAAYKKYGLPVENDSEMISILDKYQDDQDVINTVKERLSSCPK